MPNPRSVNNSTRSVIERARDAALTLADLYREHKQSGGPFSVGDATALAAELDALLEGMGEPHPDTARLRFLAVDAPFDELYGADLHELASEEMSAGAAEDDAYLRAMRRVIDHGRLIADSPSTREDVPEREAGGTVEMTWDSKTGMTRYNVKPAAPAGVSLTVSCCGCGQHLNTYVTASGGHIACSELPVIAPEGTKR